MSCLWWDVLYYMVRLVLLPDSYISFPITNFFLLSASQSGTILPSMTRLAPRQQSSFDPVLSRGIIAIIIVIAAVIIVLSFFDAAGPLGYILNKGVLSFLFGDIRYATPLILLLIAYFTVKDIEYDYRPTHGLGAALFFFALGGLFHLRFAPAEMWAQSVLGSGGGALGMLAWPLKEYLGTAAAVIILIGLAAVSLLLMFNTLIVHFFSINKKFMTRLGAVGRSIFSVVRNVTIPAGMKEETANEETYEDDEDDGEEPERFISKRVGGRTIAPEDEAEEDDANPDAETDAAGSDTTASTGNSTTSGPWAQRVVIKELPPLSLLESKRDKPTSGDINANKNIIQETLAEFGIEVDMGEVRVGPTVTQYTLKPRSGIKLSRITALSNDLSLALAAHPIRIEAPIPGKSLMGIEVPNQKTALVTLRELIETKEFQTRPHPLMIALGKDVSGRAWLADLPRMPHLLIAGATGSGKTVCMNTIIMSLLYQNTAETLRLIMVDPKRVELTFYNGIPHLLTPVITNTQQTINALKWTIGEMDRRFELLSSARSRDIHSYNVKYPNDKIPHIIFVIDELADLMATAAGEVEAGVIRLAQMARAVGIHLLLATQRPSVDVITGLMKANIPARIAFSVASLIDSRTILDTPGAEKLLGRGDMLFQTAELTKPVRLQGAFISEDELQRIVDYLKGDEAPTYDDSIVSKTGAGTMSMFGGPSDGEDLLFGESKRAIIGAGKASASFLQRKLKIGYARAARILDELEAAGVIGPADGAKPREILVTETGGSGTMDSGGELNVFEDEEEGNGEMKDSIEESKDTLDGENEEVGKLETGN